MRDGRAGSPPCDSADADGIQAHPDALRLLSAILAAIEAQTVELRSLRGDMRRGTSLRGLRAALADEFADGGFTVAGLLEIADTEQDSELACVLAALVDLAAPARARATSLGRLLADTPGIEVQGVPGRGALYRVDLDSAGQQTAPHAPIP